MVDIHTHILPGVDDGSRDIHTSLRMLLREQRDGVDKVILTPHFFCYEESVDSFLARREEAFARLSEAGAGVTLPELKLGAEVAYDPELINADLSRLTLGGSRYLLLELPFRSYPTFVAALLDRMFDQGLVPVLAHVERFGYFRENPDLLYDLINRGALSQLNADNVAAAKGAGSFTAACLTSGMSQFIASDAHDLVKRPPCCDAAMQLLDSDARASVESFENAVWNDEVTPPVDFRRIKKTVFGKYRI